MRIPKVGKRPYKPWPTFAKAHFSEASAICLLGAARVGKSLATAAEAVPWAPHSRLIWLAGETYADSREDFEYVMQGLLSLGWTRPDLCSFPLSKYLPCALDCVFPCTVETRSLGDIAKQMLAQAPDLLIICEPGQIKQSPLERCWERLSTRRGRLWMAGTLEEAAEWLRQTYDRWKKADNSERGLALSIPLWENKVSFPGGRHDREIRFMERHYRRATFMERVLGIPAPPENLVFSMVFDNKSPTRPFHVRHKPWLFLRDRPVFLAIDPGYHPSWAWCGAIQHTGANNDFTWVIDEVTGQGLTQSELIQEVMARPWWRNVDPEDAGTIDPFGGRAHVSGAASPQEVWLQEAGVRLHAYIRPSVADTIQRHRYYLRHPATGQCRLFVDPCCKRLIWEYGHWRYKKDTEGKPIQTMPLIRNCDALKGLGYYLVRLYSQNAFRVTRANQPYIPTTREFVVV